jgi:hypothetical protein
MPPLDEAFYARMLTLSDAELFTYIHQYSRYKAEAVQAAIAELHARGVSLSPDDLSEIDRYFTRNDPPLTRSFLVTLRHLRWLSYAILVLGLLSAVVLYVTASPPPQHPLGYDPFASKKYVRDLEIYGGKINVIAVELRQSLHKLWQGKNLAYTIAFLTALVASLCWYIGSHAASHLDTHAENTEI